MATRWLEHPGRHIDDVYAALNLDDRQRRPVPRRCDQPVWIGDEQRRGADRDRQFAAGGDDHAAAAGVFLHGWRDDRAFRYRYRCGRWNAFGKRVYMADRLSP